MRSKAGIRKAKATVKNVADAAEVFDAQGKLMGRVVNGRVQGVNGEDLGPDPATMEEDDDDDYDKGQSAAQIFDEKKENANVTIRCECNKVPKGNGVTVIQCEFPRGATVADFRAKFESIIPRRAKVFPLPPGTTLSSLRDIDPVFDNMSVSEVAAIIPFQYALTKNQAKEAQAKMRAGLSRSDVQQALDNFEREANGSQAKYRMKMLGFVLKNVIPEVAEHVGLATPDPIVTSKIIQEAIKFHSTAGQGDKEMLQTWRDLEVLMRNKAEIAYADATLKKLDEFGTLDDTAVGA